MPKQRGSSLEVLARQERTVRLPGGEGKPVSYRNVTPQILIDTIQEVAIAGGAIRFGFTRDGGAFALGIYGDGTPYTVYCSPHESIDTVLRSIYEGFAILGNSSPQNGGGGK